MASYKILKDFSINLSVTIIKLKNTIIYNKIICSVLIAIINILIPSGINAQNTEAKELISPIYGSLMLIGEGEIPANVKATFAYLANEEDGKLVIISDSESKIKKQKTLWKDKIGSVRTILLKRSAKDLSPDNIVLLQSANAVWLVSDLSKHFNDSRLNAELISILNRDGIVGGQGAAAESMATLVDDEGEIRNGFNLLPNSFVHATGSDLNQFNQTLDQNPGRVGWELPPSASVIIHSGREISVINYPAITLRVAATEEWPERIEMFEPPIDDLPYTTDLISWNRSARARLNEVFPPLVASDPEVHSGALVIIGGHGYPKGMWEKVIEFAGGEDANYVCFAQNASSTGAKKLREQGCRNVAVHVVKTGVDGIGQGANPQLIEDLKNADAVYFGGGRSYKFMDAYLGTEAHMLMNKVLERGGIILGGSAGAQIQGDFLVRGDPRSNNTLWMEGNDVGLGFIKGVIIDVHYRERGRENILPSLLVKHPQMLGIGIDETTAIWVQGTIAEVLGPHSVTFYDLKNSNNLDLSSRKIGNPVVLMAGEKYDLKQRKPID